MHYMVMIYNDPQRMLALDPDEAERMMEACTDYAETLRRDGRLIGTAKLAPPQAATSLRMRNGRLSTSDGPFAETKEHLGGFFLIEAKDLNDAIRLASAIPWARTGCLEVRPLEDSATLRRAA